MVGGTDRSRAPDHELEYWRSRRPQRTGLTLRERSELGRSRAQGRPRARNDDAARVVRTGGGDAIVLRYHRPRGSRQEGGARDEEHRGRRRTGKMKCMSDQRIVDCIVRCHVCMNCDLRNPLKISGDSFVGIMLCEGMCRKVSGCASEHVRTEACEYWLVTRIGLYSGDTVGLNTGYPSENCLHSSLSAKFEGTAGCAHNADAYMNVSGHYTVHDRSGDLHDKSVIYKKRMPTGFLYTAWAALLDRRFAEHCLGGWHNSCDACACTAGYRRRLWERVRDIGEAPHPGPLVPMPGDGNRLLHALGYYANRTQKEVRKALASLAAHWWNERDWMLSTGISCAIRSPTGSGEMEDILHWRTGSTGVESGSQEQCHTPSVKPGANG